MGDGVTRKIGYKVLDDAYDPSRTSTNARELVEQWGAFAIFQILRTAPNLAVYDYLNARGVPQLFSWTGSPELVKPAMHKRNMNYLPSYTFETAALTKYFSEKVENPKVAMLIQDDGFGKAIEAGYKKAVSDAGGEIVTVQKYGVTATNIDSQINVIVKSGANVFVDYANSNFAT